MISLTLAFNTHDTHALQLAVGAVTKEPSMSALKTYIQELEKAWLKLKQEIAPLKTRLNILEANALDFRERLVDALSFGKSQDSKAQYLAGRRKMEADLEGQVATILSAINEMRNVIQKKNQTLVSMKSELDERKYDLEQMGGVIDLRCMVELWP